MQTPDYDELLKPIVALVAVGAVAIVATFAFAGYLAVRYLL